MARGHRSTARKNCTAFKERDGFYHETMSQRSKQKANLSINRTRKIGGLA
jgi:hypothetical protein